ncbi:MAG TPA: creatininase family protein [Gemmatimonadales bacterium]
MNRPVRLHELTPDEARESLRASGRLLLPAGTLEMRGRHLPLGTDSMLLERLADDLSARTGVPRAPVVPVGVHFRRDETAPGVAALTRKTLHRVMNELIASWEEGAGVRETIILTAHAAEPHVEALSTIRARGSVRVVDVLGFDFRAFLDHPRPTVHGGELDTSLLLFVAPELVRDAETVTRLSASREKGGRIHEYILEQVEARWLRPQPV